MQTAEEVENSHLPCAGIILVRFYGYYLSLSPIAFRLRVSAPRELYEPVFRRLHKDR